ncbi:MAG TPA: hypothetical protein VMT85_22570 [Thermoanaerobaculia bacterium]|nr:hypothetical protein [Thermoanaerobaculia bacterium]
MRKAAVLVALAVTAAAPASAATAVDAPTFHRDVLPILQSHCQECHRTGGPEISGMKAPMSLTEYGEVRPWARSIRRVVEAREMPPWGATHETSAQLANDRSLAPEQIDTIVRWVDQGAKAGDPADAPPPRTFQDTGWLIGEPDLVITMPEPVLVGDDVADWQPYVSFTLTPEQLPEPRWIKVAEYKPNCDIIHHLTATIVPPPDEHGNEREPFFLGGIATGSEPREYPPGFGRLLHPGSTIVLSLHYNKEPGPGTGISNQVTIGLKFYEPGEEVRYDLKQTRIGRFFDFEIPPGHPDWKIGASMEIPQWALLTSFSPHMHYRGKDMKYTAHYPDGTSELLIDVARYSFEWQIAYILEEPKLLPPGTRIEVEAHMDNSEERGRKFPEIDTTRPVRWGLLSTDEMMHGFVTWSPIDEDEAKRWGGTEPSEASGGSD